MAKYQINFSEFEELCNGSKNEMLATIDRIRKGNMNSGDQMVYAELGLEDYTKKELNEALSLLETQIYDYIEMNTEEETPMTTRTLPRTIILSDCDDDLVVKTNAPQSEIENAIAHKNKLLEEDAPYFSSDFEEVRGYLRAKGYIFEKDGYTSELERYSW